MQHLAGSSRDDNQSILKDVSGCICTYQSRSVAADHKYSHLYAKKMRFNRSEKDTSCGKRTHPR